MIMNKELSLDVVVYCCLVCYGDEIWSYNYFIWGWVKFCSLFVLFVLGSIKEFRRICFFYGLCLVIIFGLKVCVL